ncbi:MYXO-CTERM sorting domain-containing protein [Nannocystis pusilla]|uniref:MYXO-CTERM sorting domain-containing protein n=1 Tax=Nannocystis pusilla TaxID=889268 RepID=UPI003B7DBD0F
MARGHRADHGRGQRDRGQQRLRVGGEPTTTEASETGGDSEGASDSATAGSDTGKDGCACAADPGASGWGVLALLLPWLGRRRRRG